MLRKYPMVVGEWSLALGVASWSTCGDLEESEVYKRFAASQLEAFKQASHGSFFWNWTERDDDLEWNFQKAAQRGLFSTPFRPFPAWRRGEDPLEEELHPSPCDGRHIFFGDAICLRTFYGRYVDVEGTQVNARWADKGDWQELKLHPVASSTAVRQQVQSGDIVRIQAHCGNFLTLNRGRIVACRKPTVASEFEVHIEGGAALTHRAMVYLECRANCKMVNADEEEDGLFASQNACGELQGLVVEKLPREHQETNVPTVSPVKKTPKKSRAEEQFPAQSSQKKVAAPSRKRIMCPAPSPPPKSRGPSETVTPAKRMRTTQVCS